MGYAVIDIVDGFTVGLDFLVHGILTLSVMLFFCELDRPQIVAPFIIMECSTIFLNFVRATFLDETGSLVVQILFAVTFTICRIIIVPPLHFHVTQALFLAEPNDCDGPYFKWVVLLFGLFFNSLNAFWFYKLIRKVRRKLSGKEKIKDKLSLQHTTKSD
jgi:TLC domain